TRRWRVPLSLEQMAMVAVACLAAVLWLGYDYANLRKTVQEVVRLRAANARQARQIRALSQQAADLDKELAAVSEVEAKLRQEARLLSPEAGKKQESPGGLPNRTLSVEVLSRSLKMQSERAGLLRRSLTGLVDDVERYQKKMAHRPNMWPVNGRITSSFGSRRSPFGGGYEVHEGIDIAAPYGSPVRATADGRVVFAGWRSGYGRLVILDHGYGYRTAYGHNSRIRVRVGQEVKGNSVIAYVGSTGRSTGPHVHYEVWFQGKKVNPVPYLP
ncbi:MAG: hypothetical protein PWP43_1202, partial [Bacillota bacterium]|nr:hypothetical protein [Bacillota bacterium]